MQDELDLADWRRQIAVMYGLPTVEEWRRARDELYRSHPQSPVPPDRRAGFAGCRWFPVNPALRLEGVAVMDVEPGELVIETGGEDGAIRYRRAARVEFRVGGETMGLTVFRQLGYGGGLFVPFRDLTCGQETYGGGRYLTDTVKATHGGGLVVTPGSPRVVLDFNYAYNPSCVYDARWACPLAPPENHLRTPIDAGEMLPVF